MDYFQGVIAVAEGYTQATYPGYTDPKSCMWCEMYSDARYCRHCKSSHSRRPPPDYIKEHNLKPRYKGQYLNLEIQPLPQNAGITQEELTLVLDELLEVFDQTTPGDISAHETPTRNESVGIMVLVLKNLEDLKKAGHPKNDQKGQ